MTLLARLDLINNYSFEVVSSAVRSYLNLANAKWECTNRAGTYNFVMNCIPLNNT